MSLIRAPLVAFLFLSVSLAQAGPPEAGQSADLTEVEGLAAAEGARADDLVNADGLLWRIDKPSLAPSSSRASDDWPDSPAILKPWFLAMLTAAPACKRARDGLAAGG